MATYQDRKGKTFKTREQAKASNLAMDSAKKGNLQKQVDILTQVVDLQKQLNAKKASGGGSTPAPSQYATDAEIAQYARQGLTEGSMIPGRGVLRPDGSFDTSTLVTKVATPQEIPINRDDIPAARGNDFAENFSKSGGEKKSRRLVVRLTTRSTS